MNLTGSISKSLPAIKLSAPGSEAEVQAILFDKDGTLMDFIYTWGSWGEQLLARFSTALNLQGLPVLPDNLLGMWGIDYDENGKISGYDRNSPLSMGTVHDLLILLALEGYKAGLSWAEAKMLAEQCRCEADEALERLRVARLLPGVQSFLEACRQSGIKLGIVTSDETEAANKHLDWLGIRDYFDVVVGADLVRLGKPYPDMVELACREMGLAVEHTAVIGDTNGDMQMARAAGAALAIGLDEGRVSGQKGYPAAHSVVEGYGELRLG
ncbi:HAD family hydrolase [Paenibacillus sanguinis]|uniref:HAD family hydrolase n=1 Tax=Paenibacillus sanguinis TaxID=225906 RepID=UPI0003626AEB|nr:HAD family hydrolase [Paenibacillus sanguinis]